MALQGPTAHACGMTSGYLPHSASAGDLVAELAAAAPGTGANAGLWPGLTIYRFTAPVGPTWEEIQSLSLCIVAQGRKAVTVDGQTFLYDPFHYLVLASHLHFQAEILEASVGRPFLSFVLQIDPALVRQVSSDMLERRTTVFRSREAGAQGVQQAYVSALDADLLGVVLRFLRAVQTGTDRRVLAPLYWPMAVNIPPATSPRRRSSPTSGSSPPDSTSRSSRPTGSRRTPTPTGCRGSSTIQRRTRTTSPRSCAPSPTTPTTSG
jgi:AraC-type transcriptional regulator N-terminus